MILTSTQRRFSLAFLLLGLLGALHTVAQPADASSVGTRGLWNGHLAQTNVIECLNDQRSSAAVQVAILDASGNSLETLQATIAPQASQHFILPNSLIADRFGTYQLTVQNPGVADAEAIKCHTAIYRFGTGALATILEYAYVLPGSTAQYGSVAGIFNSMNPVGDPSAVLNWLSISNLSDTEFSGTIVSQPLDNVGPPQSHRFSLPAGGRGDFALGHPFGQIVGMYKITPDNAQLPFSATLMRYGVTDSGNFHFAFPLQAASGSCDSGVLVASTMGPAYNWFEVGNAGSSETEAIIELRDAAGNLIRQQSVRLPAYGQFHYFVNADLGELRTGSIRVRCTSANANARLLAQSSFYGLGRTTRLAWSYSSQAAPNNQIRSCGSVFPSNTYINAANWLKLLSDNDRSIQPQLQMFDGSGQALSAPLAPLLAPHATADIGLHESLPANFAGQVRVFPADDQSIRSSLLRVFPDPQGDIATIMEVPGFSTSCPESFLTDFKATPDAWAKVITDRELRRTSATKEQSTDMYRSFADYSGQTVDLLIRSPRLPTTPRRITVEAPGQSGYSAYAAIAAAIAQARLEAPAVIYFPPGEYRIEPGTAKSHIDVNDLEDVAFVGPDAVIVFTNKKKVGLLIENVQRLSFSGLTFDWEYQNSVAVDIVASPLDPRDREVHVVGGSSIDPREFQGVYSFDYRSKSWAPYFDNQRVLWDQGKHPTEIRPGVYTHPLFRRLTAGRRAILIGNRVGNGGTIQIRGLTTEDLTFQSLRFWNTPQMTLHASGVRGIRIANCVIEHSRRNPAQLISGRADGFHIGGARGDVIIENNLLSGQGDDGINVRGIDFEVSQIDSATRSIILRQNLARTANRAGELNSFAPGDLISISTAGQRPVALLRVDTILRHSNTELQLYIAPTSFQDVDAVLATLSPGLRGFNLSKSSSRFIVKNNRFYNSAGRGMLISAPNGLIIDNTVEQVRSSGILLATFSGAFFEGPGATNVLVLRNHFNKTNLVGGERNKPAGAITAFAEELDSPVAFPILQRLRIADNLIEDVQGLAVQISHVRDFSVLRNTIDRANLAPFRPPLPGDTSLPQGSIMVENACRMKIFGNQRLNTSPTQGMYIDRTSTCEVQAQSAY